MVDDIEEDGVIPQVFVGCFELTDDSEYDAKSW